MSGLFTLEAEVPNSTPCPLFLPVSELLSQLQQYKTSHYVRGIEYYHVWQNKPTSKQKQTKPKKTFKIKESVICKIVIKFI